MNEETVLGSGARGMLSLNSLHTSVFAWDTRAMQNCAGVDPVR